MSQTAKNHHIYYASSKKQWNNIIVDDANEGLEEYRFFYDVLEIGDCGENLIWLFYKNKTLVVAGEGEMYDYLPEEAPWYKYHDIISQILIEEDVESIGKYSFYDCNINYIILSLMSITQMPGRQPSLSPARGGYYLRKKWNSTLSFPDKRISEGRW